MAEDYKLPDSVNSSYFPAKLWRMINDPANSAIFWNRTGTVVIINQAQFEQVALSSGQGNINHDRKNDTFRTPRFSSFVRQLNIYGFKKADSVSYPLHTNIHKFFNHNFRRNKPDLLVNLKRIIVEKKPNFVSGVNVKSGPTGKDQQGSSGDGPLVKGSCLSVGRGRKDTPYPFRKLAVHCPEGPAPAPAPLLPPGGPPFTAGPSTPQQPGGRPFNAGLPTLQPGGPPFTAGLSTPQQPGGPPFTAGLSTLQPGGPPFNAGLSTPQQPGGRPFTAGRSTPQQPGGRPFTAGLSTPQQPGGPPFTAGLSTPQQPGGRPFTAGLSTPQPGGPLFTAGLSTPQQPGGPLFTAGLSTPQQQTVRYGIKCGIPAFTRIHGQPPQYQPFYYPVAYPCYSSGYMAMPCELQTRTYRPISCYQACYPVRELPYLSQNTVKQQIKTEINLDTVFKMADEVMQTPKPNYNMVKVEIPDESFTFSQLPVASYPVHTPRGAFTGDFKEDPDRSEDMDIDVSSFSGSESRG